MTLPTTSEDRIASSDAPIALRVVSGVAAVLLLLISAPFTFGISLAAPFGVFAGRHLAKRRGRRFTKLASWLSAAAAASIVLLLGLVLVFALMPDNFWQEVHEAALKAQAQETSRGPAWMKPDPVTEKIVTSQAFTTFFGIVGAVIACALFGVIAGTPGWLATLMLGYAIRGRWEVDGADFSNARS